MKWHLLMIKPLLRYLLRILTPKKLKSRRCCQHSQFTQPFLMKWHLLKIPLNPLWLKWIVRLRQIRFRIKFCHNSNQNKRMLFIKRLHNRLLKNLIRLKLLPLHKSRRLWLTPLKSKRSLVRNNKNQIMLKATRQSMLLRTMKLKMRLQSLHLQ